MPAHSGQSNISAAGYVALTPELSKRARRELGLSQNDVIKATGLQAYRLKQWEGRGLTIELADMRKLSDFYEAQGVDLAELVDHIGRTSGVARAESGEVERQPIQDGFTYTPRPGFLISDQLPPELVDSLMGRMEANDDRIGELTQAAFQTGFFGGISDETEAKAGELVAALAENHVIFRCLQGRNIIAPTRDEPKTLGGYLALMMKDSPAMPTLAGLVEKEQGGTRERRGASGGRAAVAAAGE